MGPVGDFLENDKLLTNSESESCHLLTFHHQPARVGQTYDLGLGSKEIPIGNHHF